MSSINRPVARMICKVCRYILESTVAEFEDRTSEKVVERSKEERIMGLGVAKKGLGWAIKCLASIDWYEHSSFFLQVPLFSVSG